MPHLQILPGNIANMIAAGEVVQRPSSVVKELMENAVDAGATSISTIVSDSGRTLIQVIDNGCGMSPEDAALCFERHATSKIASAEDLQHILTFGFRGEALASIAAVAEVTLKTRRSGDELATQVEICGGELGAVTESAAPVGSSFSVRNLFYNVPARRKFLKSDSVELKHIVEEFTRVALTRPEIAFTLIHNGRELFVLKAAKSLKYRVMDLLGSNIAEDLVDVETTTSTVKLSGFIGRPEASRKTLGNQFLFANGRFFRSSYLHKAVMNAYQPYLPEGVTPSYFLYLEVAPETVDINIHPTKTEIKFEEDSLLFQVVYASVKEALGRNSFGTGIDFDAASDVAMPMLGRNFEEYKTIGVPSAPVDPAYNPFESGSPSSSGGGQAGGFRSPRFGDLTPDYGFSRGTDYGVSFSPGYTEGHVAHSDSYGALFEDKVLPTTQILTIQKKYLLVPARSGVMVVHFRRALQRVLYEDFLCALKGNAPLSQKTLFPVQVKVGQANRLLLEGHMDMLSALGFEITPFGDDTVVVSGLPDGYACNSGSEEQVVSDLLEVLSEGTGALKEMMESNIARRLAASGSAAAEAPGSPLEAQRLIDRLLGCENSEFSPSGKRIISILTIEEMDKKF